MPPYRSPEASTAMQQHRSRSVLHATFGGPEFAVCQCLLTSSRFSRGTVSRIRRDEDKLATHHRWLPAATRSKDHLALASHVTVHKVPSMLLKGGLPTAQVLCRPDTRPARTASVLAQAQLQQADNPHAFTNKTAAAAASPVVERMKQAARSTALALMMAASAAGLLLGPGVLPVQADPVMVQEAQSAPVGVMKAPPQLGRVAPQLTPDELVNIRVFQENTPSVVNITNVREVRDTWNLDVRKMPAGLGSGFIWDAKGHVVTNFHVIRGASEVKVTLLDQSTYTAKVVGADPDKDVAVLQLDVPRDVMAQLKPVTLGSSEDLLVGQRVFALGNPFGLDHTLTQGIISGVGRELDTGMSSIRNLIQTDAAINPGNSGGILVDSQGRVIGINTATTREGSGVGFAIPISDVKGLVAQILTTGRVQRPALGITIGPPQVVQQLGVDGVVVLEVPAGSAADKAGIKGTYRDYAGRLILGDIIQGVDGKQVRTSKDLLNILDSKKVGDKVKVEILRGNKQIQLDVVLGERYQGRTE